MPMADGFESVPCNLCGSEDAAPLFEIREYSDARQPKSWRGDASIPVVRCPVCGLVFLNPRYNAQKLNAMYQDPDMFRQTTDPDGRSRHMANEREERVAAFKSDV